MRGGWQPVTLGRGLGPGAEVGLDQVRFWAGDDRWLASRQALQEVFALLWPCFHSFSFISMEIQWHSVSHLIKEEAAKLWTLC